MKDDIRLLSPACLRKGATFGVAWDRCKAQASYLTTIKCSDNKGGDSAHVSLA